MDSSLNPWAIAFHGAANSVGSEGSVEHYRILRDAGFNVLAPEMRGYGLLLNVRPTEGEIYADARSAWRFLIDDMKVDPQRVVLYGSSLGAAVATFLASEQDAAALITNGAFTSAPELVKRHYRWHDAGLEPAYRSSVLSPLREVRAAIRE